MPFKKTVVRKRRVRSTKKVGKSVKEFVKKEIHREVETKQLLQSINVTAGWTGGITQITQPVQGTADGQRIGDKIEPQMLRIKGLVQGTNLHVMRIVVIQWRPNSGTFTPTVGNILEGAYSGSVNFVNCPISRDYRHEFKVLHDKRYFASGLADHYANIPVDIKLYRKNLNNVNFINNSATDGVGTLWFLTVQDGTATLNSFIAVSQYQYKDA